MVPVRVPPLPELRAAFVTPDAYPELSASTTGPRAPPTTATSLLFAASMWNHRHPLPSIVVAGVHRVPEATLPSSATAAVCHGVAGTNARASLPPPLHPA
ncbi:hypothetical protein E2562_022854 [Oryza meyeriana var. granulata]|uniref:Uncharacterized protein n=1 Tax=Oryza meyeriana var. granulata TaxID=110450 RepID=A0A6G1BNG1_9ORYZ|nr:hypothetical protein E2562_022854 [Oryza meyeriana var. granulata]